jgi:hypothetical protein
MAEPDRDDLLRRSDEILAGLEMSEGDEGFTALHVVFEHLKKGGFTRHEGLWICGFILTQAQNDFPEDEGETDVGD